MTMDYEDGKRCLLEAEDARRLHNFRVAKDKYTKAIECFSLIVQRKPHLLPPRQAKQHVWERIATLYSELSSFQLPPAFQTDRDEKIKYSKWRVASTLFRDVFLDRLWKIQYKKRFGGPKPIDVNWKNAYAKCEETLVACNTIEETLFWAIRYRHKKCFRHLLESEPNQDLGVVDEDGNTLIHWAVNVEDADTVRFLLSQGAKYQSSGSNGWSALHLAIYRRNRTIFELLIEANARLNARDEYSNTLLHSAVNTGSPYFVKRLVELNVDQTKKNKDGNTPLYVAVATGQDDIVEYFLQDQPDLSETTPLKWTLLHTASALGYPRVVQLLINAGADINALDCFNRTPLHWALQLGRMECINLLLDAQPDTSIRDQFNEDPLTIAASLNLTRIVSQLTEMM